MSLWEAIILGIVQGITEFLPVSSSGHLILAQSLMSLDFADLKGFDIAVHFGTMLAIVGYFWKDYGTVWEGGMAILKRKKGMQKEKTLAWLLILGTIPSILVGLFLGDLIDEYLRSPVTVAIILILVGILFFVAEWIHKRVKAGLIDWKNGLIVGVAQAMALIPGVSRSGITISTGIGLGVKRAEAARFSFLLGSVAMLAAFAYGVLKVWNGDYSLPTWYALIAGVLSSMISGYLAIRFLMKFLKKNTLHPFGWYRILLGASFLIYYL